MTHPFASMGSVIVGALGANGAISVARTAAGSYVNGEWVSGAVTSTDMAAVVQPSGQRELRQLPENERTLESISVWTVASLQSSDVTSRVEADVITWAGRTWKVRVVESWDAQAVYGKAVAVRIGE